MDRRTLELVKAEFRKKRVAPLGKGRGKQKDAQVFLFSQVKTQLVEAAREMNVEVSLINRVSQVSAHIFELRVHVRTHAHAPCMLGLDDFICCAVGYSIGVLCCVVDS